MNNLLPAMLTIKNIFVLLHIVTAAGWFGVALVLGRIARAAVSSSDEGLRETGTRAVGLAGMFAALTFLFGLIAFLVGGGFGAYGPEYHTSLLFMLVLVGIQFLAIRPAWGVVSTPGEDEVRQAAGKRLSMSIGAGHLIWLFVLVLMLARSYPLM